MEVCGVCEYAHKFFMLCLNEGELEGQQCRYYFDIKTKWACPGQIYTDPEDSSSLSGGTVFCVVLFSVVFAYFCIGWIVCTTLNRKDRGFGDVTGNIPHVTFWTKLPALTLAGCFFTKDFCVGLCGKEKDPSDESYENIDG